MNSPRVSVIIPAYNAADLVGEAIESVRRQTFQDFEILAVDDGSEDDTWAVLQRQAAAWEKLQAIRIDHAGLAAARNAAIDRMRARWIALLDADDLWRPDKLQRCMEFLDARPDLRIVYTPMQPIRLDGTEMRGHSKPCRRGQLTEALFHSIFVHDPAAVFHREVVETCGGFDESLPVCVGHEFWLRVSTRYEFGLIDEPLALRRWSERTLTRSNRVRARLTKASMLEEFYFHKGGRKMLDEARARKRLARVRYSAGKILLAHRRGSEAAEQFARAIRLKPGHLKTYPYYLAAKFIGACGGRSSASEPGKG